MKTPDSTRFNDPNAAATAATWNITSVERDTGVSKDTLRMWERRYGFPLPQRDTIGERVYPLEQVEKLRLVKRLIDMGHRPGKIVDLDINALHALANQPAKHGKGDGSLTPSSAHVSAHALMANFMDLITSHQIDVFRRELATHIAKHGIANTLKDIVAPLTYAVGEAWRAGNLQIYEEHLFTESLHVVLRSAINSVPRTSKAPKVLLTTFPQEPHGLGLLMAESMFALEGCATLSLGVQTPMWDIVQAATRQNMNIVALSFSVAMNRQQVQDGLRELRHQLPASIEIWAGGSSSALSRRVAEGVICTQALDDIGIEVKRWRALHGVAA
jgi:MerR family transcriptional regulator, light-induced transcriptional regulator